MPTCNSWDAPSYKEHAQFVSYLALPVVDLLAPKDDELILDLGCGDGSLAKEIENLGAKVIGVDRSANMVKACKTRGVESYALCATQLPYKDKFDAVFSNAVLHWIDDPKLVLEKIHRSLKDQGRFIAKFGGEGNIKFLTQAMQTVFENHPEFGPFENPWYFPSSQEYKKHLEEQGFEVHTIELIKRPTKIDDIANWLNIFANGIIAHLSPTQQIQFKQEVRTLLKSQLYTKEDGWVADYVRLRLKASKIR